MLTETTLPAMSWCQAVGAVGAKPAGELMTGEHIVYNYGSRAEVVSVVIVSPKMVAVTTRTNEGKEYTRRYMKTRLVPVHELGYYPNVRKDEVE
jgi:hypothetical protein